MYVALHHLRGPVSTFLYLQMSAYVISDVIWADSFIVACNVVDRGMPILPLLSVKAAEKRLLKGVVFGAFPSPL
jgi:hypothetical protein